MKSLVVEVKTNDIIFMLYQKTTLLKQLISTQSLIVKEKGMYSMSESCDMMSYHVTCNNVISYY